MPPNQTLQPKHQVYKEISRIKQKKILRKANFLELIPIRKYNHEIDADGNVVILVPRFTGWFGTKYLQPRLKHPSIKLSLDFTGTAVWLMTDGLLTVKEIIAKAEAQLGDTVQPASQRVTTFYSGLFMQRLITFAQILK